MTNNALAVLKFLFGWGWHFFTGVYIPGTNVTPGALLFFIFFIHVAILFIRRVINVSGEIKSSNKED